MTPPEDIGPEESSGAGVSPSLVAGVVVGAALTLFIVQNTEETDVTWLVFEATQPLWLVLVATAAASILVGGLVGRAVRRRRRKQR